MSTLTKILIVLLTVTSILLCGIVVSYVANADNFKQKYNDLKAERDAAVKNSEFAKRQLNENNAKADRQKTDLNNQIA